MVRRTVAWEKLSVRKLAQSRGRRQCAVHGSAVATIPALLINNKVEAVSRGRKHVVRQWCWPVSRAENGCFALDITPCLKSVDTT